MIISGVLKCDQLAVAKEIYPNACIGELGRVTQSHYVVVA